MLVIYIAAPFRADTPWDVEQNIRRAEEAALVVWRMGAAAICPHANTRFFDKCLPDHVWLNGDIEIMLRCDAVFVVPRTEMSGGVVNETCKAEDEGLPVIYTYSNLLDYIGSHGGGVKT
jgi:hypothetical protein